MTTLLLPVLTCILLHTFSSNAKTNDQIPSIFSPFTIKLDTSTPIKIQPDFSTVGKDLGLGVGDFFSTGIRAFAHATNNPEYSNDMSRGASGLAKNLGAATRSFNTQAHTSFFPELSATFRGFASSAINPRNVFQFGGLTALSLAVSATGYYLTRFLWDLISYKILHPKPVILLPNSTYGRWDRMKRWWNGYTSPAMIFDSTVKERLTEIENKTKHIRAHNKKRKNKRNKMNYDNLLLHGQPGTGKTLFARVLADNCNMDFVATTAASLLQSGIIGVKHVNDIVAMARRSSYGMILFIDEADSLFVDRDSLDPDSDHYKILSHILALTGDGNSTFMLIAATNHAYVIDNAMGRRFQDRVFMPLPSAETRKELINLYVEKLLFNKQTNSKIFVDAAQSLLTCTAIETIVTQTKGLSHAEIKDMIYAIHKKAYASINQMITQKHIDDAINQAIEKHNALREDKEEKEKKSRLKYKN